MKENLFIAFIALKFESDEIMIANGNFLTPCIIFSCAELIVAVGCVIKKSWFLSLCWWIWQKEHHLKFSYEMGSLLRIDVKNYFSSSAGDPVNWM